jgi:hypothetical protein
MSSLSVSVAGRTKATPYLCQTDLRLLQVRELLCKERTAPVALTTVVSAVTRFRMMRSLLRKFNTDGQIH